MLFLPVLGPKLAVGEEGDDQDDEDDGRESDAGERIEGITFETRYHH